MCVLDNYLVLNCDCMAAHYYIITDFPYPLTIFFNIKYAVKKTYSKLKIYITEGVRRGGYSHTWAL